MHTHLKLNKYQLAAVRHTHGPALVFAGAGAGKTAVIEHRTARLLDEGVDPTRILLLTFTNKAADEMLGRVANLNPSAKLVAGGTFHSWARKVLLRYGQAIGLTEDFTVLDEDDAAILISEAGLSIPTKLEQANRPDPKTLRKVISFARNNRVKVKTAIRKVAPAFKDQVKFVKATAQAYRIAKAQRNYLDFDDLLVFTERLLAGYPDVRRTIAGLYDYLMVDEFQDTNWTQARLIELVGGLDDPASMKNVMVVTDPGQSMYRFRGAWHRNTASFIARWKPRIFPLSLNYRSTQAILDLANQVDRTLIEGQRRKLEAARPNPIAQRPTFVEFPSPTEEAKAIANTIIRHKDNGTPLKNQAVLVRSIWQARTLEAELIARKIPYRIFGGRQLTEAAHIKDVLAVLRVSVNRKDTLALRRVLELIRGVGPATSHEIAQKISRGSGDSFTAELRAALAGRTEFATRLVKVFKAGLDREAGLADRVKRICTLITPLLRDCLRYAEDIDDRLKDLRVLPTIAGSFSTAQEFLGALTLNATDLSRVTIKPQKPTEEPLVISTIHSAKGLEWEVVYLPSLNDGQLPSAKSLPKNLKEERRIFYVAITRAKRCLHLSRAEFSGFESKRSTISRFLLPVKSLGRPRSQIVNNETKSDLPPNPEIS